MEKRLEITAPNGKEKSKEVKGFEDQLINASDDLANGEWKNTIGKYSQLQEKKN